MKSSSIGTCQNIAVVAGHVATADTTGLHIFDAQSLSHRPERISERAEFGHWECDLMMFRKEHGKVNVTSLVERVSRYAVVMRNEDRQSKPIMEALIRGLALPCPPMRASRSPSIVAQSSRPGSISRPGSARMPGSVTRKLPTRKAPLRTRTTGCGSTYHRSTEPTALTNRYLRSICHRLNSTPRKCLGYHTPAEVFESQLMEIQNQLE